MISVWLLCYSGFVIWLSFRLKDIKKYPQKYDKIPGYEEFKLSNWFWTPKNPYCVYGSPSKSNIASSWPFVFFSAFFIISTNLCPIWSRPYLPRDNTTIRFFASVGGYSAALFPLLAYCGILAEYSIMFSKKPIAICSNLYNIFRKDKRSVAWRKMTTIVLVATIIVCPLHLLALANVGYADNEKIIYRHYGSGKEVTLYYNELDRVEKVYDKKGREIHCYLWGSNGESFDVYGLEDVLNSDRYVKTLVLSNIPVDKVINTSANNP